MKRIFDQPDHEHYGPVRRLHLILMLIYADGNDYADVDRSYHGLYNWPWDHKVSTLLAAGTSEAVAHRLVLKRMINAVKP